MSDTLEITRQKWQHWIDTLTKGDDSIVERLRSAAKQIDNIIDMQTSAKWGTTEPGLKALPVRLHLLLAGGKGGPSVHERQSDRVRETSARSAQPAR